MYYVNKEIDYIALTFSVIHLQIWHDANAINLAVAIDLDTANKNLSITLTICGWALSITIGKHPFIDLEGFKNFNKVLNL